MKLSMKDKIAKYTSYTAIAICVVPLFPLLMVFALLWDIFHKLTNIFK